MECQENQYRDQWGHCVTCQQCGPGQELSKECGYGEGGDAFCTPCPPRRYKSGWGHHSCQACLTCAVINRVQKVNCTATSNGVCGDCLPRFYCKTRIGGLQDQECISCTKQTPVSEVQCAFRLSSVKLEVPTAPPQEATLMVLTSSLLIVFVLALISFAIIYCKRFIKRQFRHGFIGSPDFRGQREISQASDYAGLCHSRELGMKNIGPVVEQNGAPEDSVQFVADSPAPRAKESEQLHQLQSNLEPYPRKLACSTTDAAQALIHTCPPSEAQADLTGHPLTLPSCASETQSCWAHAPVECTELDLHKFSSCSPYASVEGHREAVIWATPGGAGDRVGFTPSLYHLEGKSPAPDSSFKVSSANGGHTSW
ncbi:tumor necrosis factor receptor superfamily member 27 [Sarcophilus harrisii]|uniref:Ectodysplasin A2 receptor n=1 Tax=Sarcophilus harrisii TaxID=9305 RepID=G3W2V0_SARHA|nr:tumor necrosis factor receptor superfamily member 27 [Sarcophilus harrisii]XP_031800267.1 tumor necrosis factor receptor superfamily member 27 [Sarcophilus harrisii]